MNNAPGMEEQALQSSAMKSASNSRTRVGAHFSSATFACVRNADALAILPTISATSANCFD
jgi:hypothetical protein